MLWSEPLPCVFLPPATYYFHLCGSVRSCAFLSYYFDSVKFHLKTKLCSNMLRDHITPAVCSLHWLPVCERIRIKLAILMHRERANQLSSYLSSMITSCNSVKGRSYLRSTSVGKYVVPIIRLVFNWRSFIVAGSSIWNSLPPRVRNYLNETVFLSKLKTYLFQSTCGS